MSGLPASGKSRLGAAIAPMLGLALLDKDDFLETLYERDGIGDAAWRERLSRRSDQLLRTAAMAAALDTGGAVLASFWRHPERDDGGGTPSEWLRELPGALVEVHCRCLVGVAIERFRLRDRHPGHLDAGRRGANLSGQFDDYAARGPLGLGTVISVDTSEIPDAAVLAAQIRRVLGAGG